MGNKDTAGTAVTVPAVRVSRPCADYACMTVAQLRILRIVRLLLASGHGIDDRATGDAVTLLMLAGTA